MEYISDLKTAIHKLVDRMKTDRFYNSMMECFDEEDKDFMYEATLRVFKDKDGLYRTTLAMNKKIQAGHLGFFQNLEDKYEE